MPLFADIRINVKRDHGSRGPLLALLAVGSLLIGCSVDKDSSSGEVTSIPDLIAAKHDLIQMGSCDELLTYAQKAAIPRQIRSRSQLPYAVILPEVPGKMDAHTVGKDDADYLMLDLN